MFNKFKIGSRVIILGPGKFAGKMYKNLPAFIMEYDYYFKDYHVLFKDGTDDWIDEKYIRKPYSKRKKRSKNES